MYLQNILVVLLCATVIKAARVHLPKNVGIIGGHEINIEDAPYMASLRMPESEGSTNFTHMCGGSIIHEKFILTAAHCLKGVTAVKVVVGSAKLDEGGEVYEVEELFPHENFTFSEAEYDIGLIKLNESIKLNKKVQLVDLTDGEELKSGLPVDITGWGFTKDPETGEKTDASNELQQVQNELVDVKICRKIYKDYQKISKRMICAGELGKTACNGDSGGPLTANNVQIGVVSLTKRCSIYPVVYTKVSEMLPWILETIDKNYF